MAHKYLLLCLFFKVAHAQYYAPPGFVPPPPPNYYPTYSYPTYSYPQYPAPMPPPLMPPAPMPPPAMPPTSYYPQPYALSPAPTYSQPAGNAYFLPTTEKLKANVIKDLTPVKAAVKNSPPSYPCPLCEAFKNVVPNLKVPPPPKRSVLSDTKQLLPCLDLTQDLVKDDFLSKLSPKLLELCEKPKSTKYRFDEDLVEGFLSGLGLLENKL